MAIKLVLVRHGEATWNRLGKIQGQVHTPLTDQGKIQAQQLAHELKTQKIDKIYSSKLLRAQQTAEIIQKHVKAPVFYDHGLGAREFGDFSGQTIQAVESGYPKLVEDWYAKKPEFRPPNGESTQEFLERTAKFLDKLANNDNNDKTVLLVTHREVIQMAIHLISQTPLSELKLAKNCQKYELIL